MQEQSNVIENHQMADEISIKKMFQQFGYIWRYLLFEWKWLLMAAIAGGGVGFTYVTFRKPVYTAECTFVLEEGDKANGGLGQYSNLASMIGIDVGGGGGSIFQGDNIIELYKSRLMIQKTLLSSAVFFGKKESLIDRFVDKNGYRKVWIINPKLKNINFDIPENQFTLQHDSIIGMIVKIINKNYLSVSKPDKKLSIISVKVKAKDELFAKAFTDGMVSNVNNFYIKTKTKGSLDNLKLLQFQTDSIRRILNASIAGSAAASDYNPNPNPGLQVLRVPSQRKQVDVQASTAMYAEIVKNLEIAKGVLQRETPLIQVIDKPILPLDNDKASRLVTLIIGAFIAIFITITWLLIKKGYKKLMS